jgi:hypothetical protein
MTNTIRLKPHYLHLKDMFTPYLSKDTNIHKTKQLPHLQQHSSLLSKYPLHFQLYAFIIAINPLPQQCNLQMAKKLDPRCLTILRRLDALPPTCPFNHMGPPHPTQLTMSHTTQTPPITLAYDHINQQITQKIKITQQNLQKNLPFIPLPLIKELIKCNTPITGFTPNHNNNLPQIPQPKTHKTTTTNTHIITWNT